MSKSEVKKIIKKYAENLRRNNFPVSFVYFFGSRRKGTNHKDSDIDVAVISPKLKNQYTKGRFNLWKFRHEVDLRIEPHGFTPEDWANDNDPMVYEIKKTGLRIA